MKPIVTNIIISALKGEAGSNPEIHSIFPNDNGILKENIIQHTLPTGARSTDFFDTKHNDQDLLVFVSELKCNRSRNGVVSISFLLNDNAEKNAIISVLKTIFSEFHMDKMEKIQDIVNLAKILYTSLNSKQNFQFNGYVFDIQGYLNSIGLSIEKQVRKVKGGLF